MTHDPGARSARLTSIDTLRGSVMILMALDHVRDYFGAPGLSPLNLAQTTVPLFLTRWITHLCAPTFFLLTGTSAFLARRRRSRAELSRFLFLRGVWLIVLELTVIRCLGFQFNADYQVTMLVVIWALGWAMVVLAALVWLPTTAILIFGVVMVAGHNLLDGVRSAHPLWVLLHSQGIVVNRPGFVVFVAYPLVPWVAVMAAGWVIAAVFGWEPWRRRRFLLRVGAAAVAAFIVLRYTNGYGNTFPWTGQRSAALTVASFLNVRKYPPSLDFLLMTLGPILIAIALTERVRGRIADWLAVYGRVPLFYYVVHFSLAHVVGICLRLIQGGELAPIPILRDPASIPAWYGVSLPGVYVAWALVVALMYYPCRWFADLKRRRTEWWLTYL